MEVLDEDAALLSDFEVQEFIREVREQKDAKGRDKRDKGKEKKDEDTSDLQSIDYQLRKYFEKMPCAKQTEENVVMFLQRTKEFDISKVEKLQLLNYRPASLVDLFVILENCEDRFSAEQLDQILETVQELFPMDQA